ncbi:hypothetical protein CSUI_001364 [Cystoisospora suis]|uniref:Uncharacterized protein n=1 Tax=Cystoisospora suis TaxID=483139 RepID=A0A2C6LCH7_9APIC|nr:hypothetical protein CSUI_001364 [Cystoisospora suis]
MSEGLSERVRTMEEVPDEPCAQEIAMGTIEEAGGIAEAEREGEEVVEAQGDGEQEEGGEQGEGGEQQDAEEGGEQEGASEQVEETADSKTEETKPEEEKPPAPSLKSPLSQRPGGLPMPGAVKLLGDVDLNEFKKKAQEREARRASQLGLAPETSK